jgi:hypothetical protein
MMNEAMMDRVENKERKIHRFGLMLAVLAVLYIGAVIAFIIAY